MYLLGIDPGLATTGFAIIRPKSNGADIIDFGVIVTPPKTPLGDRLMMIYEDLGELLGLYSPEHVAIEEVFFDKNVTTGIHVSHARGVIIQQCASKGMGIHEFNPMEVKKYMTGHGGADKKQIQQMLFMEYGITFKAKHDDAADAVAIALLLRHHLDSAQRMH